MAEGVAGLTVSIVANRLSELLIHEGEVLSKVESPVEDIRRELMQMKAIIKQHQSSGHVEDKCFIMLVEDLNGVALNAEDVIQTFLDKSVRMPRIFTLMGRYKVEKKVEEISKRVRKISRRMKHFQYDQTRIGLMVETLAETSRNVTSLNTKQGIEKVRKLLSQRRMKYDQTHQTNIGEALETLLETSRHVASPDVGRISKKTRNLFKTIMKHHQTNIGEVVETLPETSRTVPSPNATEAPVVEKLSDIPSENLVADTEVQNVVEEVRDEVAGMENVVSDLKSKEQSNDREKVLLEEASTVPKVGTLPETPLKVASPRATEVPAVEKLSYILNEKLIVSFEVENMVKEAKDEVVSMLKVVSNLKSKEQSSERGKVWLEEANTICNSTISVIEDFITTQSEGLSKGMRMGLLTLPCWPSPSEDKLMKEMEYIKTQVRGALVRRLTYGVGEEDVGYIIESIPMVPMIKYYFLSLWSIVSMRRDVDPKLEFIQRELALMHAFFRDIRGVEVLNERQRVWVHQMRELAQQAEALLAAYEPRKNNGLFWRLFQHIVAPLQFEDAIDYILYKMRNNWERKAIYDIANIEEREGSVFLGPGMQGSGSEIHIVVEHNGNSGTEKDPLLPAGVNTKNRLVKDPTEKVIESIREDMELMKALFRDAQEIGELDRISKIWVELMKNISPEMESVSNEYASKFEDKPIHIRILNFPHLYTIQSKINQIRNNIQEASRIKKRYGLIHIQTRAEPASMVQRLRERTKPSLHVRESNIIGFDEDVEVLMENKPPYLRRCLSYFVLFPVEFEIPTRRLIALWVAEGLVRHEHDQEPPEQVAERYLTELIDLNIVQVANRKRNGKMKTCRLPDALRQSLLLQRHTSTNPDSVLKKLIIRQVADHLDINDFYYNHIHSDTVTTSAAMKSLYKDILSFLSFDTREGGKPGQDIGKFLDRCISRGCFLQLRVLDLERVYKPQLSEDIANLSQLRYIGLRWTYLESLPSSLSSLLKLQTLDLKHTYISILPSSIWKMQMRHLFLSETYRTRFPPHPKGNSLSNLQTLWGLFVDEKTPVKGGLDRLVNVRKLGLACQSMSRDENEMTKQLQAVAEWIMNIKYLQSLRLKSRKEDGKPGDLHLGSLEKLADLTDMYLSGILISPSIEFVFPPNLIELTLSHSNLQRDSVEILGDLPNLQLLSLFAGSYIEEILHCKRGSFPQLYFLEFWNLKELKEWNIEEEAFPHLKQLEIRSCECLQMLPDGLEHISTLGELKLTTMSDKFMERVRGVDKHKIPSSCNVRIVTSSQVSSNSVAIACSEGRVTGIPTKLIN